MLSKTEETIEVVRDLILEIPCMAKGTPEPERVWKKDGIQVLHEILLMRLST